MIWGMGTIYAIRNKTNGAEYIGSAVANRLDKRWVRHRTDLRSGKHHSRFLQRAWDKYGELSFEFIRVEEVEDAVLLRTEQRYLDARKSGLPRGMTYNVCWKAGNCFGRKASAGTKRRLSLSHMGIGRSRASIRKQKTAWALRCGKPRLFLSPDGRTYRNIRNVREFARKHGLCPVSLGILFRGKIRHYKGWTVPGRGIKRFDLIGPDGVRYDGILLLKKFCVEHGLPYKQVHKLFRGVRSQVLGWRKG